MTAPMTAATPKRLSPELISLRDRLIFCALLLLPLLACAQSQESATGGEQSLRVGGEYSLFQPDFGPNPRMQGAGAFVDVQWNSRWAAEGETRFLRFGGYQGETETNYLAGPRYVIIPHGRFRPWGEFLVGAGDIHFPYQIGHGGFFAMAPAGGVDVRLDYRLTVRASYEYQFWPSAPGVPGEPSNGMHPNGVTVGASWRIR
ncbi:MAG: outer membrane beta-barrel protein [Acidobacteriaceae bacterium]